MPNAANNTQEPTGCVFMTLWMLADIPEQFHPIIEELFKQGKIKLIMNCPNEVM